jgi:hypothetical protein
MHCGSAMSTTVTGSPSQGQVASYRRGPGGQAAPASRRMFRFPRASTTPGKLRLARAGLEGGVIVLALVMAVGCGWGLTRRLSEYR